MDRDRTKPSPSPSPANSPNQNVTASPSSDLPPASPPPSNHRPTLQRQPHSSVPPPNRSPNHHHPPPPPSHSAQSDDADSATDTGMSDDGEEGSQAQYPEGHHPQQLAHQGPIPESALRSTKQPPIGDSSPDELEIERLRSLQLKAIQKQQRARGKSGASASTMATMARRVSPIKEEPALSMSPTLEGAFSSPLPTGQTTSTASTESTESARTIRGSVPPTPAGRSLRTPSYPFPTVPNTPMTWSNSFHQPFTSLSPTVSAMYGRDFASPREQIASESSTPAASAMPFAPGDKVLNSPSAEDPRYPSPNMYELVLQLCAEPGLAAWWATVTTLMQDYYGVQRATLAVPADTSDIENVPWGQKTTFHSAAPGDSPQMTVFHDANSTPLRGPSDHSSSPDRNQPNDSPPLPSSLISRPKLPSRHSFAGHERQRRDIPSDSSASPFPGRPRGPLRTASHVPQSNPRSEHPLRQVSPVSLDGASRTQPNVTPMRGPTFSDPDFSSVGGADPSHLTAVFPVLRALDHEPDALIDNSGINRVLERGRVVTLTRDYSSSLSASKNSPVESDREEQPKTTSKTSTIPGPERNPNLKGRIGKFGTDAHDVATQSYYEEYEQFPSSPWAQSPAPSPAIQNDPSENPFFSAGNVDEDTFNPSSSTQDYAQFGIVEAIGVDKASTVTHIPLIHPTQSQAMQPHDIASPTSTPSMSRRASDQTTAGDVFKDGYQRKAPIAILSILSPVVPYPRNLTNSLKLLGPHLATSFSNAWQFTNAQAQATGIRQRRFMAGQQPGGSTVHDPESLDELLHLDLEDFTHSAAGSVTSPSDYSSRSRHSPGGSFAGTPGWDPSSLGLSSKHSIGSTPGYLAGSEAIEGYFDAKKKTTRASSHAVSASQEPIRKPEIRLAKRSNASIDAELSKDDISTPTPMPRTGAADDVSSTRRARVLHPQSGQQNRGHSLLHSYGADFSSSFQSLPAATTPARTPGAPSTQTRSSSIAEGQDVPMPPPSENLLRTIIDSLPVQIFTALPTTGALTWANAKFLIYRGQESHQVLRGPWDAIHPEDRTDYIAQWNKSLRTGQQLQQKVRLRRFDDCYRWFYVRVAPLKNKRQQIVHWIGTNMDFHEQHLAELNAARQQETAASEAKYRALANSSPQVVFVVSNRRGLTFCNSQWQVYSGQTEAQARGNGFLEHVHPDDIVKCKLPEMNEEGTVAVNVPTSLPSEHARQTSSDSSENSSVVSEQTPTSPVAHSPDRMDLPQAKLSKLASTGILKVTRNADGRASYSTEVRLRNKDGEYRWHLVRVLLEKSLAEDNDEETWYGTCTDINDHKLLEQTLKETMDAKTRFLSNMSHEIRTPLNGISGMVNFLLDSVLNAEQLEHVNIIKASTDSLLNLINDILDLSKVEAGMIKLTMEWLHLPSLLEEVNDLNMGLAIQKGLELNYLMEEDVPSMVKGDKFRIRQVLLNVVGNAIKFTQKGEIFVRCQLQPSERSSDKKDNETVVRFEVIDTGGGFSEHEAKYLFKRFSQIDGSSTRQHGGTGLGLAISMQFVELHGGIMNAHSIPGKGSTFFFTIKFGLPTDTDFPQPATATPGTPVSEPTTTLPPAQPSSSQRPMLPQALANVRQDRMSSTSSDRSESIKSPVPSLSTSERSHESPSLSSGSSDHSLTSAVLTGKSSLRSERTSASSFLQEASSPKSSDLKLALPTKKQANDRDSKLDGSTLSPESEKTPRSPEPRSLSPLASTLTPPMFSILVVCPLTHSREATIRHIKNTLPADIPHQVTGQSNLFEAQKMIGGDNPVLFTHVVLVLHDTLEVIAIMDQILNSMVHGNTSIVVVSDPTQKKDLMKEAPAYDYTQLITDRRLQFIYRPLKPSKFAVIFDPQKERELSTDRNQDTAQQVVFNQKLVFEELKRRLGGKGHKVLLVEDNHINQTVILKFLARISVETETVLDGAQCTDIMFSKPPGYFSIILCDLHMPNKDGYQACKEIRRWEKKNGHRHHPIIALSANVLGDVYAKCVEAGFNSYVTKPVEFKELSMVMTKFLDPVDKNKPPEFMRVRKR